MSNKNQTAIEWLQEQLECFGNKHELQMSWTTVDELLKQAKEIEKEQIEDSYIMGSYDMAAKEFRPRQYYEDTYGEDK
jgi:hypothetical protein